MAMGAVNPSRVRTLVVTSEYMFLMMFIIMGGNPWSSKALKIMECGTELKALDKSNQPITSSIFLALASRMTSCRTKLCSKHPSNWRKPFCDLLNRSFSTDHPVGQYGSEQLRARILEGNWPPVVQLVYVPFLVEEYGGRLLPRR